MIYTNHSVKVSTSDVFPHKFNFNDHPIHSAIDMMILLICFNLYFHLSLYSIYFIIDSEHAVTHKVVYLIH